MQEATTSAAAVASWRRQCGFTKAQAARALGKTWHQLNLLERGRDYSGRPVRLPESLRRLMAATARHGVQQPWPEA
jgi:hypothetical protein